MYAQAIDAIDMSAVDLLYYFDPRLLAHAIPWDSVKDISSMPASPGRPCTLVGCSPHARQVSIILSGCVFAWYYF